MQNSALYASPTKKHTSLCLVLATMNNLVGAHATQHPPLAVLAVLNEAAWTQLLKPDAQCQDTHALQVSASLPEALYTLGHYKVQLVVCAKDPKVFLLQQGLHSHLLRHSPLGMTLVLLALSQSLFEVRTRAGCMQSAPDCAALYPVSLASMNLQFGAWCLDSVKLRSGPSTQPSQRAECMTIKTGKIMLPEFMTQNSVVADL
eukprot:1161262-Pelagomonas_calceolata.AAC.9